VEALSRESSIEIYHVRCSFLSFWIFLRRFFHQGGEVKHRAFAFGSFHPDLTVYQSNQLGIDGKAQAGSLVWAVKRIRPKLMLVGTTLLGLVPIMFSTGTGADVMKRIAVPMVGGIGTSTILELLIYPVIYVLWKQRNLKKAEDEAR